MMTIITFLAPFLPPFWKASELEPKHKGRSQEGGGDRAAPGVPLEGAATGARASPSVSSNPTDVRTLNHGISWVESRPLK